MTADDDEKAYDALDRLNRETSLRKRLDQERKVKEKAEESSAVRALQPIPNVWESLSVDYRQSRLESGQRKMFRLIDQAVKPLPTLTPEFCEEAYAEEKRAWNQVEAAQRALDNEAKREADRQHRAANKQLWTKVRPYCRVMPRDWENKFEILLDPGIIRAKGDGKCRCGYDYAVDLINCIDVIWASDGKFGWFKMDHRCFAIPGEEHVGRMKIGGSFGVYIDVAAMASASLNPENIQWSIGPPPEANAARPLI